MARSQGVPGAARGAADGLRGAAGPSCRRRVPARERGQETGDRRQDGAAGSVNEAAVVEASFNRLEVRTNIFQSERYET